MILADIACPPPRRARPARSRITLALLVAGTATLAGCVTPEKHGGPIPIRNQHPAQLVALRLDPISPRTTPRGTTQFDLKLAYSSLFLRGDDQMGNTFVMDGEILRAGLKTRYGVTDTFEVEVEIPTAHTTSGFLDSFVEGWHDTFGLPSSRDNFPQDIYAVRAESRGQTVFAMEQRSLALLDLPIGVAWQILPLTEQRAYGIAVRGAIELPTGDEDDGFGNGGVDVSLGAVGEVHRGPFSVTAHFEHTWVHTPDRAKQIGFEYADVTSGGIAIEAAMTHDTAAIVQYEVDKSVLRHLKGVNTDDDQSMLWVGFRTRCTEDLSVEISFGEDLSINGPPDFSAYLGFRLAVGG